MPYPLRILAAEVHHFNGNTTLALDKLYELLAALNVHIEALTCASTPKLKERASSSLKITESLSAVSHMPLGEVRTIFIRQTFPFCNWLIYMKDGIATNTLSPSTPPLTFVPPSY